MEQEHARVVNGERIRSVAIAPLQEGYLRISLEDRKGRLEAEWLITAAGFRRLVDDLVRYRDNVLGPLY